MLKVPIEAATVTVYVPGGVLAAVDKVKSEAPEPVMDCGEKPAVVLDGRFEAENVSVGVPVTPVTLMVYCALEPAVIALAAGDELTVKF